MYNVKNLQEIRRKRINLTKYGFILNVLRKHVIETIDNLLECTNQIMLMLICKRE